MFEQPHCGWEFLTEKASAVLSSWSAYRSCGACTCRSIWLGYWFLLACNNWGKFSTSCKQGLKSYKKSGASNNAPKCLYLSFYLIALTWLTLKYLAFLFCIDYLMCIYLFTSFLSFFMDHFILFNIGFG